MGSSVQAVAQCTPHHTTPHTTQTTQTTQTTPPIPATSRMVVLDNKHNPDMEEEEEEECSVVDSLTEEEMMTERSELGRLHQLLPTLCIKENVTQLDIILEAIRYIDSLTHKLEICNNHDTMDHHQEEEEDIGRMT